MKIKILCLAVFGLMLVQNAISQGTAKNFIDFQKQFPRISDAISRKEDTLIKQFQEKKLVWPAPYLYIRSFKFDSQLEVWVKYSKQEAYQLFKTYKVCALSGSLGPKRMQGDYQVPEGFYYVNEFNPKSMYHLSLGLNYPNSSDRKLADSLQPGGEIYIHGSCVTTGCIPITNQQIEELYILASHAKNLGQDFIPVHIYPIQYKNPKSVEYLTKFLKDYPEYTALNVELKRAYAYFEKNRQLPIFLVNKKGEYQVVSDLKDEPLSKTVSSPTSGGFESVQKVGATVSKPVRVRADFPEENIAKVVDRLPEYPGGIEHFQKFIDQVSKESAELLPAGVSKTYVMVEFVIDQQGKPVYAKVLKGGTEELNDNLEQKFEKMQNWKPAVREEKNVAVKLKQSIFIERVIPSS